VIVRLGAISAALAVASGLGGCSHDHAVACEPIGRYVTATTAAPVRIPDDLNPPDETDSLRMPPDSGPAAAPTKPCLESPPGYYADGAPAPGRNGAALERRSTSGGGQRPAAAAPPPAAPPPQPPPAVPASAPQPPPAAEPPAAEPPAAEPPPAEPPPSDGAPAGGEREINN
jgi:hypothetical protein